jgi:hypothetical protein
MDRNEIPHDPRHLGVPSSVSKMISNPTVRSAQTVHLSCVKIRTISKWSEMSFNLSLVTKECHRVHQKWFFSLWYIYCKLCTYLAPTLTLSPNRLKWDSTRPTSPRRTFRCIDTYFWAYGMFCANRAPILRQDYHYLQTDRNELPLEPRHLGVPSGASRMISGPMVCLAQTVHLSYTDTNTISIPTETRFHMTHVT